MKTKPQKMKKELGVVEVFCIASGAMISSGLFVLPALVYAKTGPAVIFAYLIAAIMVVPALFAKAELATAMPKSGGDYFFVNRSLGALFGTLAGFATWFSISLKSAFALVGIGIFLEPFVPVVSPHMVKLIAVLCTLFFAMINIISVKHTGRFQVLLVVFLIVLLVFYVGFGFSHIDVHRFVPFSKEGPLSVFFVAGMIFVSFGGLTKVASIAEEIRDPGRSIPRGMFAAYIVVTAFYALVVFITVGLLDPAEFTNTQMPISLGASKFAGNIGYFLLSGAALIAFITTGNAGLLSASRAPLAMAKDNLIPSFFSRVNVRLKTPIMSIVITALFMIAFIVFLDLEKLVKVASTMKLLLFAFVTLSVILMRESRITSYKPVFHSPFYPYIQVAGVIVYILLIFTMPGIPLIIAGVFFVLTLIWYLLYSKSRSAQESALIHVVERVTSKEIRSSTLTDELRDILMERDSIVEDRFDKIMKEAIIIDITEKEDHLDSDGLFALLSREFTKTLQLSSTDIFSLLQQREKDSTTAIHAGLAIPHIVVDQKGYFEIVVVRSKKGISFGPDIPPVHIVFALAGSKEERAFHLQALMAIAQIVQNKDFEKNWLKLRSTKDLKTLILLAERVRKASV